MLTLLDKNQQQKHDILSTIFKAATYSISFTELQLGTHFSTSRLIRLLSELNHDLGVIDRDNALVRMKQGNQYVYYVTEKNPFICTEVYCHYLQASLKFKLLVEVFKTRFQSIETLADKLYTSVSSLRREIKALNRLTKNYNIGIQGYAKLQLVGPENAIRLFYSHLFFEAFQSTGWPTNILQSTPNITYLSVLPTAIYSSSDTKTHLFITYIFGVCVTRCLQGIKIETTDSSFPLYTDENDPEFNQKANRLHNGLKKLLGDSFTSIELDREVLYIYSLVLSHKSYFNNSTTLSAFFLTNNLLKQFNFMNDVSYITSSILDIFNIPLDNVTYYELLTNISVIHYRLNFFYDIFATNSFDWILDKIFSVEQNPHYYVIYDKLEKKIDFSSLQMNHVYKDYFLRSYSICILKFSRKELLNEKLNVLFITDEADFNLIHHAFQSEFATTVTSVDLTHENIDAVVSDTIIHSKSLELDHDIPIIYFEPTSPLTNIRQITATLFTLQLRKNNVLKN